MQFGRRPGGRRFLLVAVLVVALVGPLAVAGWIRLNRPEPTAASGRFDPNVIRTVAPPPTIETTTTTVAPLVTTTTVAPTPAAPETVRVAGSSLRRGVARPISGPATVADVRGSTIGLYSTQGQAEADDSFDNPTWEGLPLVFLVQQRQGDWLEVQLNTRPNQTTAWIRAADVTLRQVTHRVVVSLAARSLTVYEGQTPIMEAPVAIGDPSTPTPRGNYYVAGAFRRLNEEWAETLG